MDDKENPKKKKIDANKIVSPENMEKLYGKKAQEAEAPAGGGETVEETLPEDFSGVDQDVAQNMFPSKSDHDPHDLSDI